MSGIDDITYNKGVWRCGYTCCDSVHVAGGVKSKLLQDMVGEGEEQEEVAEALANLSDYCSRLHQLFV